MGTEPRIVTPEEARSLGANWASNNGQAWRAMAAIPALTHTVATEPERTRAAVVAALRKYRLSPRIADAIENGAPF